MPYGRRYSSRRRFRRNRRRNRRFLRNRSSKRQAYQLSSVNKRLSALNYRFRTMGNPFTYYNEYTKNIPETQGGIGLYGYTCIRLHPNTQTWRPCLDQPTQAQLSNDTWYLKSTTSKFRISIGNEETNPIRFTAFIIQVRRNYRDITYYNLGTDLQDAYAQNIPGGNDPDDPNFNPWNTTNKGQVFLNKKIFKVIKRFEFTLGQVTSGSLGNRTTKMSDTVRDFTHTQYYGKYGSKLGRSSLAVDQALDYSQKTLNRNCWTFLLIVSNDSTLDISSGSVEMTQLHNLRTRPY